MVQGRAADPKGAKPISARVPVYDEKADAAVQIETALAAAKRENRRVLIQWGANWYPWCVLLHERFRTDKNLARILRYEYDVGSCVSAAHPESPAADRSRFPLGGACGLADAIWHNCSVREGGSKGLQAPRPRRTVRDSRSRWESCSPHIDRRCELPGENGLAHCSRADTPRRAPATGGAVSSALLAIQGAGIAHVSILRR
jgi:hypothetical protein